MEYQPAYFAYKGFERSGNAVTRRSYLTEFAADREGEIIKDFTAADLRLSPEELAHYQQWFRAIGYEEVDPRTYRTKADGFTFHLAERPADATALPARLEFSRQRTQPARELRISKNIRVRVGGESGCLVFG